MPGAVVASARRRLVKTAARGDLSGSAKVRLGVEVLVTYVPLLRLLRSSDVGLMTRACRGARPVGSVVETADSRDLALRLGFVVGRVLEPLPSDSRCLIRALVLLRMLARRGIAADLVIGVKPGPPFEAHAWLEHDGLPVLPAHDFVPLHRG
jgi:hypothetical protein